MKPCVIVATVSAMNQHDVLNQLRYEWTMLAPSATSQLTWQQICREYELHHLERERDFGAVLLRLEPGGGLSVEQRSHVITILLKEAGDRFVHRALLQTLLPGVVSVCRQLKFGRGIAERPSDVVSEAIALLSELIRDWAGQWRTYAAPDLLSALRGRLRRWLLKEKEVRRRTANDLPVGATAPTGSTLEARLELLRRQPQHARLAQLTWLRVFAERPLKELATQEGISVSRLREELQIFAKSHLL